MDMSQLAMIDEDDLSMRELNDALKSLYSLRLSVTSELKILEAKRQRIDIEMNHLKRRLSHVLSDLSSLKLTGEKTLVSDNSTKTSSMTPSIVTTTEPSSLNTVK